MKLTQEQFQALSQYERNFTTAIKAKWSAYPGENGVRLMHEILCKVTGTSRHLSMSCGACILQLVTEVGRIYFADKAEAEKAAAAAAVAAEDKPKAEPKKKATTKKK